LKILVIHNPRSGLSRLGSNDSSVQAFLASLSLLNVRLELRTLEPGVKLEDLLSDAHDFDRVVVVGGDGTVGSVAHLLSDSGLPIVVFPAGTGNLLAANLGLPTDPAALALVAVGGDVRVVDLGELEFLAPEPSSVSFVMAAGIGYDATIMAGSTDLKPWLGLSAYFATGLTTRPTMAQFRLTLDGRELEVEGIGVMIANHGRVLDLDVIPDTDGTDGLFDVAIIKARSGVELVPVFARAIVHKFGWPSFDISNQLEVHRASLVQIEAVPALPVQFDGELLETSTPITARVRPGAARFLVPKPEEQG
jgi:diacylglycerol kinase family enzyme